MRDQKEYRSGRRSDSRALSPRRRLEQRHVRAGQCVDLSIDTVGLYCPVPIIRTSEAIHRLSPGEVLEVVSDDRVILIDMPAWCLSMGHAYLGYQEEDDQWRLYIRRQ